MIVLFINLSKLLSIFPSNAIFYFIFSYVGSMFMKIIVFVLLDC